MELKLHPHFIETSDDKCYIFFNWIWIFISTMFITIATVLGLSILALPVKAGESGITPVIFNIVVCGIFQIIAIFYMIELLMRTDALLKKEYEADLKSLSKRISTGPSYYDMGRYYFWTPFRVLFEFFIIFFFCSLLIAYTLSSSSAIAQLLNIISPGQQIRVPIAAIIPFFVTAFTLLVIYAFGFLRSIVSVLTGIKVSFLMVIIFGVGVVASEIDLDFKEQWQYVGRPFLISTVALGNALSALPIIYAKLQPTKNNIRAFRGGAITGIIICCILCILWTFFILKTVPQNHVDNSVPSLKQSELLGEICTIPLVKIIHQRYPEEAWLGIFITLFIIFSLTISYIIVTASLKQQFDGYIKSLVHYLKVPGSLINDWFGKYPRAPDYFEITLYVVVFSGIVIISMGNTSGLFLVLERASSFALNVISGLFVGSLFFISRRKKFDIAIPDPIHSIFGEGTLLFVFAYFSIAIFWDILTMVVGIWIKPLPF